MASTTASAPPKPHSPPAGLAYGSDAIAHQLSRLNLRYLALVPGSSFRGLHDSLVNFSSSGGADAGPEMLICLHEEHAVAIAHGYGKVAGGTAGTAGTDGVAAAGRPTMMAAAVHANVGLMHAAMGVYNAWCDRTPLLLLGATGPLDAGARRPWIDWIHSAQDQGALVRAYVKFDDQPLGVDAAVESVVHAYAKAAARPCAPVYVCLDVSLQEGKVEAGKVRFPDVERYLAVARPPGPAVEDVERMVDALKGAKKVLFMFGRVSRELERWEERIRLAEKFDARVVTDIKQAAAFPTDHRLHASSPSVFITPQTSELIRAADLIVSLDWVDLAGTMKAAVGSGGEPEAKIVHISMDSVLHNGWSKDHFALPPADISIFADPDQTLSAALKAAADIPAHTGAWPEATKPGSTSNSSQTGGDIFMPDLATALYKVYNPKEICIVRLPLGWSGSDLRATHPLSFLGMDGGAGIGSGPGMVVGAALAIRDQAPELVTVGVIGDGDFLMGNSAIWTAAKYRIPLLLIVANNASYFNDEVHQERVAKHRGRPVENKWIGMRLDDPAPNLHEIARGLGCSVVRDSQVKDLADLDSAMRDAADQVKAGRPVVLDVRVLPEGYSGAMSEKSK